MRILEKSLTALKDRNLTAYDCSISGMGMKIKISSALGLNRIKLTKLIFVVWHLSPQVHFSKCNQTAESSEARPTYGKLASPLEGISGFALPRYKRGKCRLNIT